MAIRAIFEGRYLTARVGIEKLMSGYLLSHEVSAECVIWQCDEEK
jgi:hypothetical protein